MAQPRNGRGSASLAAYHHERAAFHHETAAHHHERAASHHAAGHRSRANLHADSAYEHEQRAGEHAEQAFRINGARDENERDDSRYENLDRVGLDGESSFSGDERGRAYSEGEIEPRRARSDTNTDRRDEPDYGVNGRSESTGTARESS